MAVGYSGTKEDLEKILDASEKIQAVYTGGLAGKIQGGRPQYVNSLNELEEQVEYASSRGVKFEIALNAPCGLPDKSNREWWNDTANYLQDIESIGVHAIIASHPFIMSLTKEKTEMEVIASTICEVITTRMALHYEKIGADIIIPSMNANMNLRELRMMKRSLKKSRLRLMVNEHCLGDCPWRRFHHNHYAHSNTECDYHANCKSAYYNDPYLLLTNNAIRPEDIHNYFDITRDIKIVGRLVDIDTLVMRIQAYDREEFDGNFIDLLDSTTSMMFNIPNKSLDGLIKKKLTCKMRCDICNYCRELADKVVTVDQKQSSAILTMLKHKSDFG
jgi:collagenase-like PrtC family protease